MKKIKNKQVPAYAFGIDQITGIGQLLGTGLQAFTGTNNAQPGYEEELSGGQQAGSAISGAATGAASGFMVGGPIGAAAGGIIGGIGSLFGGINRNKQIRRRNQRIRTQRQTDAGLNIQAGLEQDYYGDNSMAYTFANGGIMNTDLAFVDNSEVMRDINGNLAQVPNTGNGIDEHLINATGLDSVLSDRLTIPGTNQTFAQAGETLMKKYKPSKGNDSFAETTNELNKANVNAEYNRLLAEQENMKAKKGITQKSKGVPAYANGMDSWPTPSIWNTNPNLGFGRTSLTPQYNGLNGMTPMGRLPWFPQNGDDANVNVIIPEVNGYKPVTRTNVPVTSNTPRFTNPLATTPLTTGNRYGMDTDQLMLPDYNVTGIDPTIANQISNTNRVTGIPSTNPQSGFDFSNILSLAPTAFNFIQGMRSPEQESIITNPYASTINRTMARRRMNINPMIEANRSSRSIANYNASNLNSNTGANLALRAQMAADEYRNNANIYATAQNTNNQYAADYANTLNNLGTQYIQQRQYTEDINARNRAAARNYTGTAASQLGQWAQVQQQMNNQQNRDDMVYPLLESFLSQGYTQDQINNVRTKYMTNRRRV